MTMNVLILGLVFFLGTHSIRIVAEDWRAMLRRRYGERVWKLAYSLLSLIGFVLIIRGYGIARHEAIVLWNPLVAMRHIAAVLTLMAFILLAAAYVPRNSIRASTHHPMVLGVMLWAFAHLLANGTQVDLILFGSFLIWSALSYLSARKRDRTIGAQYASGTMRGTAIAVAAGIAAWALFAFWLHAILTGVRPFP